jgi:DUF4097 and DUF4098 domain-containing protein YvlB
MASPPVPTVPRRRSFAGPVILIAIGIVFLMGNVGVLTWHRIFFWFAHYWPVLLILWGAIKLFEYFHAQRRGYATSGIGAGGVFLLIFIICFGMIASFAARRDWRQVGEGVTVNDNDLFSLFGNPYNFQDQLEQPFTPGSSIEITSERGDISLVSWDEPRVKVLADKRIIADNENEARRVHESSKPVISAAGRVITIAAGRWIQAGDGRQWGPSLRTNLQVFVPRKADVKLQTRRGDVTIDGREGRVEVNNEHGSVTLRDIKGSASLQIRHGDVRADRVTGDLNIEGRADDVIATDVTGTVALLGDFFGETRLARVGRAVRFSSSRTEMETGKVEGELTMDSGDLRASQLAGLKINTRSKDIHLESISGSIEVANRNATVELHADKTAIGNISINNDNGSIQIYIPANAAFQIQASTRGGDIESDFGELKVESSGNETRLNGAVGQPGAKAAKVQLNTDHADIEIRKQG